MATHSTALRATARAKAVHATALGTGSRLAARHATTPAHDPDDQPTVLCDRRTLFADHPTPSSHDPEYGFSTLSDFDGDSPDGITDAFTDELLDELPRLTTDVTEVTETGIHRSAPLDAGFDALEAQIPTLKTSREPPTPHIQPLMNRANPTPVAPVRLSDRSRRELSIEPPRGVQLSIEPPTDVTDGVDVMDGVDVTDIPETPDVTDVTELGPPPIGFEQPAPLHVRNRPATPVPTAPRQLEAPAHTAASTLAPRPVRWTLLDEYGWWLAGAAFGGVGGGILAVAGVAFAVMNGSVVL